MSCFFFEWVLEAVHKHDLSDRCVPEAPEWRLCPGGLWQIRDGGASLQLAGLLRGCHRGPHTAEQYVCAATPPTSRTSALRSSLALRTNDAVSDLIKPTILGQPHVPHARHAGIQDWQDALRTIRLSCTDADPSLKLSVDTSLASPEYQEAMALPYAPTVVTFKVHLPATSPRGFSHSPLQLAARQLAQRDLAHT